MTSEVRICNLALARLGDAAEIASIDPPEGSAQAGHCQQFYPIARDTLLEMHTWLFATRRAVLAQLHVATWDWDYAYARPSSAIKIISILPQAASGDDTSQEYETEAAEDGSIVVLTDQYQATIKYIARVTDTAQFSPLFVDALAWLLASYLAGPVMKGDMGIKVSQAMMQQFALAFAAARVSDSNQRMTKAREEHKPAWISGR